MRVVIETGYEQMSEEAFRVFREKLPASGVVGFATGKTPIGLYRIISEECLAGGISFKGKSSFNLDEYYPMERGDGGSYWQFMEQNLFRNIDIERERINFPYADLPEEEAVIRYRKAYAMGGPVDLQIVGIGANGHMAFNEPGSAMDSTIRIVDLSPDTIRRNGAGKTRAITMGIKEILESRSLILIASGEDKAGAVNKAVNGEIGSSVPASFLRLHSDVTFVLDEAAGSGLS